jgi:hypothetical protein
MPGSSLLQPPPEVAAAAILILAGSDKPRGVPEALDLLRSIGIGNGAAPEAASDPTAVFVTTTGAWRTSTSLMLAPHGTVGHFGSHLWSRSPSEPIRLGFDALVDAISNAIGAPGDEDVNADGSRSAYWKRPSTDIEVYFHAERPRADAAVQIGVSWPHDTPPHR